MKTMADGKAQMADGTTGGRSLPRGTEGEAWVLAELKRHHLAKVLEVFTAGVKAKARECAVPPEVSGIRNPQSAIV